MFPIISALLAFVASLFRSRASLCLAHLALRHQLAVYPEFAVYRHLRTRPPCIDGASFPEKLTIHRYMNRKIELDIKPLSLYIRRHVPTHDPTATPTWSRRDLLPARRKLLP
jgi:hypothetical protein